MKRKIVKVREIKLIKLDNFYKFKLIKSTIKFLMKFINTFVYFLNGIILVVTNMLFTFLSALVKVLYGPLIMKQEQDLYSNYGKLQHIILILMLEVAALKTIQSK